MADTNLLAETERLRARVAQLEAPQKPCAAREQELAGRLPLIMFEMDAGGRFVYLNRRGLEATGYSAKEGRGLEARRIVVPEDEQRLDEALSAVLQGQACEGDEYTVCTKDGSRVLIEIYAEPILETGRIIGARGACIDITERRRAEEAFKESETFLSSIYRGVEMPIFVVDAGEDGAFRYAGANPAWERLVGTTASEIQGRAVEDLEPMWGAEVVAQARSDYAACLRAGKTIRAERRHAHRDREIWFLRSLTPVQDATGRHARIIGSIVDMTEIRQAQRRLRLFRDLLDHTNEAIFLGDLDSGDLLDVNEAACRLTGLERSELLGLAIRDVSARIRDAAGEPSPPNPVDGTDSFEMEGTLERKDGGLVPVEASTRRVELEGQRYLVEIVRDASVRRRAEQLRASLRRSETMSAMGRLVGGVAHEVRNPLFAISATLDAFEQHFAGSTEHEEYAELLRAEVDRMGALMQDLLDYGRPPPTRLSELPLQDVIRAAARSCNRSAEAAGVTLEVDLPSTPLTLPMDQARLQQVFQNLVGNAIQHTPRGGRIRVSARAEKSTGDGGIVCTVEDSGPGFAWDDLPHLFEPFFTRRRGGTGLGLAIAQRIVEGHGGEIVAQNLPDGGGAQLTVSFPSRPPSGEMGP